jgi:hypothetical protein
MSGEKRSVTSCTLPAGLRGMELKIRNSEKRVQLRNGEVHGSAGRAQLVTLRFTLLLFSTHQPWINWQSTAGHTSVTLHSSPLGQLAEHHWSHFDYSSLITRGSADREQLLTLLLLSTHHLTEV